MLTIKTSDDDDRETWVRFEARSWVDACTALVRAKDLCLGHRLIHARLSNQQGRARVDVTLVYLRTDRRAKPVGEEIGVLDKGGNYET
jgi:hypothetical protein